MTNTPSISQIATILGHAKKSRSGYECSCPCHDDQRASLSLTERDGRLLFKCHAGCDQRGVADEFRRRGWLNGDATDASRPSGKARIVATFPYVDEAGDLLYEAVRYEPKDFGQRRPDGNGEWLWNLDDTRRVLYRLPELLDDLAMSRRVFVVEGERKVDLLRRWNLAATCNAGGAEKWRPEFSTEFRDADVIILPDNDEPGRKHAGKVAASLAAAGAQVRVLDLPDLGPKGDIVNWAAAGGTAERLLQLVKSDARPWVPWQPSNGETEPFLVDEPPPIRITARPYVWRLPATIPPRQWLHAGHYIRGYVSATIAPGGLGKTSLQLVEAVGMAAGRNLLGGEGKPPLNVWYWNLEDPLEEIERRIAAILIHYEIAASEIEGRLFVTSGRNTPLVIAERQRDAALVCIPVVEALKAEIKDLSIDVLIVDPFISCHRIPENDNPAIDLVVKTWGEIAGSANIAVELAHHVRKPGNASAGSDFDIYDARGAGSFTQAARSVRVLNTMSIDAERVKIPEADRRAYFRVDRDAKANMKPSTQKADWRKFMSICLENATADDPADWIGVVIAWKMPGTFDGVETYHLRDIQKKIAGGEWLASPRSPSWAGVAVAEALDLDASNKADRARIAAMLKTWVENKALKIVVRTATNRHEKEFVEVGGSGTV